jgi:hypothetical protein
VVNDAFLLLRTDLYDHLGQADELALKCDEWTEQDANTARELIPALVNMIRALLIEHAVTPQGNCRICSSVWPCPVVTTIHGLVKDPEHGFADVVMRARSDERQSD